MPSEPCRRGYDTAAELAELTNLARSRLVLELGSHRGDGTLALASSARQVWTIDHFWPNPAEGDREFWEEFMDRTRIQRVAGQIIVLIGPFDQVVAALRPRSFGLVFVDGFHDYDSQSIAVQLSLEMLAAGGILAVHDWGRFDVIQACERLLRPPARVVDSLAIWS